MNGTWLESRRKVVDQLSVFFFCFPRLRPKYVEISATGNDPLEVNEEEFIS